MEVSNDKLNSVAWVQDLNDVIAPQQSIDKENTNVEKSRMVHIDLQTQKKFSVPSNFVLI